MWHGLIDNSLKILDFPASKNKAKSKNVPCLKIDNRMLGETICSTGLRVEMSLYNIYKST